MTTRIAAAAALAAVVAVTAGGCAESPKTSYTDAAGATVTVDWADYPAAAWIDSALVLGGPMVEQTTAAEEGLIREVREALDAEFGAEHGPFRWREVRAGSENAPADYDEWHPMSGNGYGGDSMLLTYNSPTWEAAATIPQRDWERVIEVVAGLAARHGLAQRMQEEQSEWSGWMRTETLLRGDAEWLSVSVLDTSLDDRARRDAEEHDWILSGIQLFYGITTIREAERAEFERRAAPFLGLQRPEATHSD